MRCAVDGTPVSIRGTDYEFLHSGPGDLDSAPEGYAPANGVQDLGAFATMYDMPAGASLVCFGVPAMASGYIRVAGRSSDDDLVAVDVPYQEWTGPTDIDAGITLTVSPVAGLAAIDRVVLPGDAAGYISLYAVLDGEYTFLSRMHPSVQVPEFHRYRLPGFSATSDVDADGTVGYNILAEVRLRALPMVDDNDALPFDSLLPVQYMLMSMSSMNAGETKTAGEYRQAALGLLAVREDTKTERQGLLVINSLYDNSLGEASERWFNL